MEWVGLVALLHRIDQDGAQILSGLCAQYILQVHGAAGVIGDDVTPQAALAAVAGLVIASQVGNVGLRNVLEARYGKQAWYRIKPLLKPPDAHRFTAFVHIDEALQRFTPTRMSDFLSNIENTGK